eukprot:1064048-Pyramimonas_sp.AAC.1
MEATAVPVIALPPENAGEDSIVEAARAIDKACRDVGFFAVRNHGVPDDVVQAAWNATRKFFDGSAEEKMSVGMPYKVRKAEQCTRAPRSQAGCFPEYRILARRCAFTPRFSLCLETCARVPSLAIFASARTTDSTLPSQGYPYGYSSLCSEALSKSQGSCSPPDLKETFSIGPKAPSTQLAGANNSTPGGSATVTTTSCAPGEADEEEQAKRFAYAGTSMYFNVKIRSGSGAYGPSCREGVEASQPTRTLGNG